MSPATIQPLCVHLRLLRIPSLRACQRIRRRLAWGDVKSPRLLLLLVIASALLAGCGVKFSDKPAGTEFFKSLTITGDMRAGAPLTAAVGIAQQYDIDVAIACQLRKSQTVLKQIGTERVPLIPGGGPKATPVAVNYSFDFTVDAPGTYNVKCLTPSDENNFILKQITIRPGTPTPPASG